MISFRKHITELLIQKGLLTLEQVEEILNLYTEEDGRFSNLLITKNFIKKETLSEFITNNLNLNHIPTSEIKVTDELLNIISPDIAKQYSIFPISKDADNLTLALADPLNILDLEDTKEFGGCNINPVIVSEDELAQLIQKHYSLPLSESMTESIDDILGSISELPLQPIENIKPSDLAQITQEVPIIKATNFILNKAIKVKASDILIEPLEKSTRIRFRIDGLWHQMESLPKKFHPFIISRIKVISDLDIAEQRLPQDGQLKMKLQKKEVDFRVSAFPCVNGGKIAIRILDKSLGLLDLDKLGLKKEEVEKLKNVAHLPHGMILVCGPAGSGKTTTLYSLLKFISTPEKNIITVEDPVEYEIKGINQVGVNPKIGLNFSRCLRSILRQDPNIIMIGEIRDFETVDIAIKSALTGHLVLSTLHTTTAAGSVIRLLDMGVEPFLINASLICIISQRLVRRICNNCKEKVPQEPYFRGRGCKECFQTGYSGRVLIPEILYMSTKIRETIASRQLEDKKIKEISRVEGMKTLREQGLDLAEAGITSLEEVLRVTPAD